MESKIEQRNLIAAIEQRIFALEEKVHELEKRPTARYCELCSQTTFQKFVRFKWEKNDKEFEICPKCARLEYKNKERARQEKDWKGYGSKKFRG